MAPSLQANLAILTLAALGCTSMSMLPASDPADRFMATDHPAAALAWAKAHCWPDLERKTSSARVQAEDLMNVAHKFNIAVHRMDIPRVCSAALAIARPTLAAGSGPAATDEAPLSGMPASIAAR